jgi:hypothetical protein
MVHVSKKDLATRLRFKRPLLGPISAVMRPARRLRSVKQLWRWASVPKPPDAQPNLPAFAFGVQMLNGHLVCGFVGISGRDEPGVLLFPAAAAAKLDLVYVHDTR